MLPDKPVLSVQNLSITFAGNLPFNAVSGISFSLRSGKTLAIVGESGSGKSLTALALMGLLPKGASLRGRVILYADGKEISLDKIPAEGWPGLRGRIVSIVFQEPMSALNPVMKVGKQLRESILAHGSITNAVAETEAIEWLRRVQLPSPESMYHRYPHQLSGGQKQRVMIAMAMSQHPAVLLADEPTTALDVTVQKEVLDLMRALQSEYGTAMIFITHDLALAAELADEALVLYRGKMMEYGPVNDVLHQPQNAYTKALLACRPAAQEKGKRLPVVTDFTAAKKDAPVIIKPLPAIPVGGPLLSVENLRVWFPDKAAPGGYYKAVDDVSFVVKQGEVLGLVGESGCGKSTLSRAVMGLAPVHSGNILFGDQQLAGLDAAGWRAVRRSIQMIFQDPYSSLNPRMTIGDMLTEPLRVHLIVSRKNLATEARRLLDAVQLPADSMSRYPHQFSGGQRQRIGIARALALRPKLLICDESVSALDVSVQAQILNLLKDLQAEFGLTYLFISHDLHVVHYIADEIMVMKAGKIIERGSADEVLENPKETYTQQLIAALPEVR